MEEQAKRSRRKFLWGVIPVRSCLYHCALLVVGKIRTSPLDSLILNSSGKWLGALCWYCLGRHYPILGASSGIRRSVGAAIIR